MRFRKFVKLQGHSSIQFDVGLVDGQLAFLWSDKGGKRRIAILPGELVDEVDSTALTSELRPARPAQSDQETVEEIAKRDALEARDTQLQLDREGLRLKLLQGLEDFVGQKIDTKLIEKIGEKTIASTLEYVETTPGLDLPQVKESMDLFVGTFRNDNCGKHRNEILTAACYACLVEGGFGQPMIANELRQKFLEYVIAVVHESTSHDGSFEECKRVSCRMARNMLEGE